MAQPTPGSLSSNSENGTQTGHPTDLPEPTQLAREMRHLPGFVYLDSVPNALDLPLADRNRFSLLTACPTRILRGNLFLQEDFNRLHQAYTRGLKSAETTPDLGFPLEGLYGYVGYEGDFVFGEYPEVLVYDHHADTWTEKQGDGQRLADRRIKGFSEPALPTTLDSTAAFCSDVSKEGFCDLVSRAQEYIAAGDIYQVNLSHRFEAQLSENLDLFPLYEELRDRSPAPFSAFCRLDGCEILSSSPEEFLSISGRTIRTRPIKGTRPRFRNREQDEKSAYDLITSAKEVAELIMITDLERNDLGQICEFGSVEATELLKLERFAQVFHLVSTIEGTLRPEIDALTALQACFPGGSITGAPKKRAREIIEELEPIPRGLYTGAIGCFGFNGESRFNIAIRTAIREGKNLHFHVGAGIVADSIPEMEWEETLHKASGILQAFTGST